MVSRSIPQVGKWSWKIGGGALVLALVGLIGSATIPSVLQAEVIEVHSCAPGWTDVGGTCWPNPLTEPGGGGTGGNDYPGRGGSGGGGGGISGGGGGNPPGGGMSAADRAIMRRLASGEKNCTNYGGTWGEATFDDIEIDDFIHIGYVCITQPMSDGTREWRYYDSEGFLNHACIGDSEVRVCE